ncbi:hypothetical protein FSP39_012334 [Pinctada imbricata]|uniref:C1q domain-containing protein n=1 Tax=Pinctada imbricata TaxID=66713 RepID=A0AA89BR25_PINIB|nr:hypothetical protein FSP39_012334 [Pinctada imbricata]
MSSNEHAPSRHHTLIFDVPRTNIGNSYNKYSGLFTAPSNGVYHFSWTIYSGCHSNIPTEILRNDEIYGAALADSEEDCDAHESTTNVIIELNQGDIVFIRTNSKANSQGDIKITEGLRSTFSGFKLN